VQYTGAVASLLKDVCQVQHAPATGGGSANNAANGLNKLQNCRWLRTAGRPDLEVKWDIIQFNFGLHDLPKADPATPALLDEYTSQMDQITAILKASGAKHIQYALTTPFQADAEEGCGPYCDTPTTAVRQTEQALTAYPQPANGGNGRCGPPVCKAGALGCGVPNATAKAHSLDPNAAGCGPPTHAVSKLNQRAVGVMAKHNVTTLDLNALVHSHCGQHYTDCDLCDDEHAYMGVRCGYHYSSKGIPILAQAVADSFERLLQEGSTPPPMNCNDFPANECPGCCRADLTRCYTGCRAPPGGAACKRTCNQQYIPCKASCPRIYKATVA